MMCKNGIHHLEAHRSARFLDFEDLPHKTLNAPNANMKTKKNKSGALTCLVAGSILLSQ